MSSNVEIRAKVETHSGYKADEYPIRFWIGKRRLDIIDIEDRWYSPDHYYFKVFADDANRYILKKSIPDEYWTVIGVSKVE